MLRTDLETMNLIEAGVATTFEVVIHFQQPETYAEDIDPADSTVLPFLSSVGDLSSSMSVDGGYEIGNTTIVLKNRDFYFSRRFARELPNKRLCQIFMRLGAARIERFRGIITDGWKLTPTTLTLQVNV